MGMRHADRRISPTSTHLKPGSCFMKGLSPHRNGLAAASSRYKAIKPSSHAPHGSFATLTIGALGIVYGDIGTSPLYAMDALFQPSTTAQAPDVEERKPEVPSTEVGEPKLPSAPSAQPPATARTRRIDAPKPEVQSSEVGEPKQASNSPVHPSLTTQVPIPAQDFADRNSLAPVIIALNVVLPFLSIGILIWLLKSAQ